jgi:hypothetical protein
MTNPEASISQAHQLPNASSSSGDVLGEFASSAWQSGVARPLSGIAQLAGADVKPAPDQNLTGAMRAAHVAGAGAGVLTDLIILSTGVGKAVGAVGEALSVKSLMAESSLTRSLTTSGTTGFVDGFAINPAQPGEGTKNRFYHGIAEGAGFMALDRSGQLLSRLPENAITNVASRASSKIGEVLPNWMSDSGRSATDYLGRNTERSRALLTSAFPKLTAENMSRNAIAGLAGGDAYYSTDTVLNGRQRDLGDLASTSFGWAAANAIMGGKLGPARGAEVRVEAKSEPTTEPSTDVPPKVEAPPPPVYKPEIQTLENGDQQWSYQDVPNKGDLTTYTKNVSDKSATSNGPRLDWEIKTADGKVYNRNTKGPWEINYPDGTSLQMSDLNYLSFSKPITVLAGGKPLAVKEVTQLELDQRAVAKQWVYEDPAVPNQTITFNADRSWEADGADGKSFNRRSPGPWKVTNMSGILETKAAGSKDIDVELLQLPNGWFEFVHPEQPAEAGKARKPQAFVTSAKDTSPMSLSALPRTLDLSTDPSDI